MSSWLDRRSRSVATGVALKVFLIHMTNVKIFGAGSIGNHLAHGCRTKAWGVTITDTDPAALQRTKSEIYPDRYGAWDESIRLEVAEGTPTASGCEVAIIGTPPDSHFPIAKSLMQKDPPKVILIEKPLATPDLAGCQELADLAKSTGTTVLVDYNHTVTPNTKFAESLLAEGKIGALQTLLVRWVEHWGGIYKAHPWLAGPADTYLGFWKRGGGALGEHSHGVNIWQHFARKAGEGRVTEVSASIDYVTEGGADYDQLAQLALKTENGLLGAVVQDVVTEPPTKNLRLQGEMGFFDWYANYSAGNDALIHGNAENQHFELFPKARPDDFKPMIEQIDGFLAGEIATADLSSTLEHGLETMLVIAAAFRSNESGKRVAIDYAKGWSLDALSS